MPIPLLAGAVGAILTARNGYIVAGAFAMFKDEILSVVNTVLEGDSMAGWVTEKVNARLAVAGVDLTFRNVFNVESVKGDVDIFAAQRVNAKAGTNFTTLKNVDREGFLVEVSKVLADRVNTSTGSHLTALWPVARLRDELGTELARQFDDGANLSAGGLFPARSVSMIRSKIGAGLKIATGNPAVPSGGASHWGAPRDDKHAALRAAGRKRQAAYRRSHRQVWVPN